LPLDLTTLIQYLSALSSLAVTLGVIFVVFQLRQNAKLIEGSNRQIETANRQVEASIQQNRQQVILSTVDRFTDESFIHKRKKVRDIVKKYEANGWKDFLESEDDYEVKGFLGLYESTAFLARIEIVDVKLLVQGMGYLVVNDWIAIQPVLDYYRTTWQRETNPNFHWLYDSVKKEMESSEMNPSTKAQQI